MLTPAGAVELRGAVPSRGAGSGDGERGVEVIAVSDGATAVALRDAGVWRALDARGGEVGMIAVNADAEAARVETQTPAELSEWLNGLAGEAGWAWLDEADGRGEGAGEKGGAIGELLSAGSGGAPFSLPVLLAAAVVALAELVLARWSSHARGMRQEGPAS